MRPRIPFLLISSLIVLLLLLVFRAGDLSSALASNLAATGPARLLVVTPTPSAAGMAGGAADGGGCLRYPALMHRLQAMSIGDAETRLQMLDKGGACLDPERRALLTPLKGELLHSLGRYTESCELLSSVGAKTSILAQSEDAYKAGNWEALSLYMGCIEKLRDQEGWVSPGLASEQYYRLGLHYDQTSHTDEALEAYTQAILWNPGVYSGPLVGKAHLLSQLGRRGEAVQLLQYALAHSAQRAQPLDNVNLFILVRELASLWEADGNFSSAYCANREGQRLVPALPAAMKPQALQANLEAQINRLPTASIPDAQACQKLIASWIPDR